MPRAFAPEEAETKLLKIEPRLAIRASIGPKLSKKFPHLASQEVACNISTHSHTTDAELCCIAATDPAGSIDVQPASYATSSSIDNLGPHIREGSSFYAAELAEAVTPLAAAVAAADASAAPAITKTKSKPFRIPKRT